MKIAVLSDTRLPTSWDFPGHGLGKMVLTIAEGLEQRGHDLTLFAGPGSEFTLGELVIAEDEDAFAPAGFDAVLDSTHGHRLQQRLQQPIVNYSQDREAAPGKCAVFPSEAHKRWHKQPGRVIYNGVRVPSDLQDLETEDYFLYLSMFHAPKGPIMAWNAARLAGVRLVMAGPTPPAAPPGVEYVGPMAGEDKLRLLARARALIFPASTEAGPVTVLEAQALGTPVICTPYGAALENVYPSAARFYAADTLEMAETVERLNRIEPPAYKVLRKVVRHWVESERSVEQMVDGFERALKDAASGEVW